MQTIKPISYQVSQGRVAPIQISWAEDNQAVIDFPSQRGVANTISTLRSVYVDNTQSPGNVSIVVDGIGVVVTVLSGLAGVFPVYSHGLSRIAISSDEKAGRSSFFFADFEQSYYSYSAAEVAQLVSEINLKNASTTSPATGETVIGVLDSDTLQAVKDLAGKFKNTSAGELAVSDSEVISILQKLVINSDGSVETDDKNTQAAIAAFQKLFSFSNGNLLVQDLTAPKILSALSGATNSKQVYLPSASTGVMIAGPCTLSELALYNSTGADGFLYIYDAANYAGINNPVAIYPFAASETISRGLMADIKTPFANGVFVRFTTDGSGLTPLVYSTGSINLFPKFF